MADIIAAIDHGETLALLRTLVCVPSPTGDEGAVAAALSDYLRRAGFADVKRDERHNVLLTLRGPEPGPALLFLTHLDTAGVGAMEKPYSADLLPGEAVGKPGPVVWGKGAVAPKSAVAAMVGAAAALVRSGLPRRGALYVAAVTKDMEANHAGVRELLQSFPFTADLVIAGEPSGNSLVLGARGINHIAVELTGQPAHWGQPKQAVNPLYALAEVLAGIEAMALPVHPIVGPATVSAFQVSSEAAPPKTPYLVRLMVDRRTLPGESTDAVLQGFEALVQGVAARRPGISGSVGLAKAMHSFSTEPGSDIVARVQAAVRTVSGRALPTTYITFSSNAGYAITEKGWPGVALGPGHIGDVGDREHVELAQLEECTRIYAAIMSELLR